MGVILGLLVAASFGSGDFLGGLASRRAKTLAVLAVAQVAAVAVAIIIASAVGGGLDANDFAYGIAAGALNVVAIGCLVHKASRNRHWCFTATGKCVLFMLSTTGHRTPFAAMVARSVAFYRGHEPEPLMDGVAAREVLSALLAALESHRLGRPVDVPARLTPRCVRRLRWHG